MWPGPEGDGGVDHPEKVPNVQDKPHEARKRVARVKVDNFHALHGSCPMNRRIGREAAGGALTAALTARETRREIAVKFEIGVPALGVIEIELEVDSARRLARLIGNRVCKCMTLGVDGSRLKLREFRVGV